MLPKPLAALAQYKQFLICRLTPSPLRPGKTDKIPCNPHTGYDTNAHQPSAWVDYDTAALAANRFGPSYRESFVLTDYDSLFCLDIDQCLQKDGTWSPEALAMCKLFRGAAMEISQSGQGLHIWGTYEGVMPPHTCRVNGYEFYHTRRVIVLGQSNVTGDASTNCTDAVDELFASILAPVTHQEAADWTDGPIEGSRPIEDDGDLIRRAKEARQGMHSAIAGKASFAQLWEADVEALGHSYPGGQGRAYDASSADMALACHLAFWTGNDCERMAHLMRLSALRRDKWEREDYLHRTILKACSLQTTWYCQEVVAPVVESGSKHPFYVPNLAPLTTVRSGTTTTRRLTEQGNVLRLLDKHEGDIHYVMSLKKWIFWQDGGWAWDDKNENIFALIQALPEDIYREGEKHIYEAAHNIKWALLSETPSIKNSTEQSLRTMSGVSIDMPQLDADTYMVGLNKARTVLDLKTGIYRPAERQDYVTKYLNVEEMGDPTKCVRWLSFLREVFKRDEALIDWVRRWCGLALTGDTKEHMLLFAYGSGRNGKSTFAGLLSYILNDYARAVASATLNYTDRNPGAASSDLVSLIGARLAVATEIEMDKMLAEVLVKSLTGGDTISARPLYGNDIQFKPQFKLLILGNHKPIIRSTDKAMWDRICLLPFTETFEKLDKALPDKLREEAPDILAWMVTGCLDWQKKGNDLGDLPEAIKNATAEYRAEMDVVGKWIDECCVLDAKASELVAILYASYRTWAVEQGMRPQGANAFGRRLEDKNLKRLPRIFGEGFRRHGIKLS